MLTLKFGGTSMGSAARILNSADIVIGRAEKDRVSVVVSAVAGVSNLLADSITKCASGSEPVEFVKNVKKYTRTFVPKSLRCALPLMLPVCLKSYNRFLTNTKKC